MFKKLRLLTACLTFIYSFMSYAEDTFSCPDFAVIQAEGFHWHTMTQGRYELTNFSRYNTDQLWMVVLTPVKATSEDEAFEKGNSLLQTLKSSAEMPCMFANDDNSVFAIGISGEHTGINPEASMHAVRALISHLQSSRPKVQ